MYDSASPHVETLPAPYSDCLTAMQQLIVLRCLRPDKVHVSLSLCLSVCVCVCVQGLTLTLFLTCLEGRVEEESNCPAPFSVGKMWAVCHGLFLF